MTVEPGGSGSRPRGFDDASLLAILLGLCPDLDTAAKLWGGEITIDGRLVKPTPDGSESGSEAAPEPDSMIS
jgi:hypothetical protein